MKAEAERLDMFDKAAGILAELLFDKDILNQITLYRPIFLQFVYDKTKAQRHLLEAVEGMIATDHPELMSKVPHILKALYDADLVEEEAFFDWHGKVYILMYHGECTIQYITLILGAQETTYFC